MLVCQLKSVLKSSQNNSKGMNYFAIYMIKTSQQPEQIWKTWRNINQNHFKRFQESLVVIECWVIQKFVSFLRSFFTSINDLFWYFYSNVLCFDSLMFFSEQTLNNWLFWINWRCRNRLSIDCECSCVFMGAGWRDRKRRGSVPALQSTFQLLGADCSAPPLGWLWATWQPKKGALPGPAQSELWP